MAYILAVTGAITTATRLSKEIEKNGCINARVIHTPSALSSGGCSYAVKVPDSCLTKMLTSASDMGIKIRKLYRERLENGEKVYDDIS